MSAMASQIVCSSKKTPKRHAIAVCEGNPSVTGGFPSWRVRDEENVSIWWHHNATVLYGISGFKASMHSGRCFYIYIDENQLCHIDRLTDLNHCDLWSIYQCYTYTSGPSNQISKQRMIMQCHDYINSGIILCMHPANGRQRYSVTSSLIGLAHTQNESMKCPSKYTKLVMKRYDILQFLRTSLKRKCRRFDEILITGCTGSCHFDNFQCSQWWKFHQNEDISVSVIHRQLYFRQHRFVCKYPTPCK